jgi:hypothetical protein
VNNLAAAVLAAGELICEFTDGYRKSLLAEMAGDPPRTEVVIVYEYVTRDSAQALSTKQPGRRPVTVRAGETGVHFIQDDGPSVRVTTLTGCTRKRVRADGEEVCTRFDARHGWHFDTSARLYADRAFARQPSGGATGACEPWRLD